MKIAIISVSELVFLDRYSSFQVLPISSAYKPRGVHAHEFTGRLLLDPGSH